MNTTNKPGVSEEKEHFASWWFLNGGGLHRLWKEKRYSTIHELAKSLPRLAWEQASKEKQDLIDKQARALEIAREKVCFLADKSHGEYCYSHTSDKCPDRLESLAAIDEVLK